MALPKPIAVAVDPPRLYRAVKRRLKKWYGSRLATHTAAVTKARERGQVVIADMDWYGYSNVDLSCVFAANPILGARCHVQKIPREAVFSFRRNFSDIRRNWKDDGDYTTAIYGGLRLWEVCKASVVKELGAWPATPPTTQERLVIEQFYHWAVLCINGVEQVLDGLRPHAVVVFQGGLFDSRCVVECAARRGIRTIAVETSFIGDHALVDSLSGIIVNRHSLALRGSTLYDARVLVQGFDPVAFWQEALAKKGDHHRTGGATVESLRLPKGKRFILVIGQVAADASITMDSPVYGSPAELIADVVVASGQRPGWHIIARLHPKEAWHHDTRDNADGPGEYLWDNTLRELQAQGLDREPNLTIVSGPGVSTYDLMRLACLGVTINSQAGLEMALLGKPVITTGRCFYAHNGFTWDIGRRELLPAALDAAIGQTLSPDETRRLHDYCSYLFTHFLIPLDPKAAAGRVDRLREVLGAAAF